MGTSALSDFANNLWGTEKSPRPGQLAYNWLTGRGSAHYDFGPESKNTQEMMTAPGVQQAREQLYNKYQGLPPENGFVNNYKASFGLHGLFTADTLTEQFVGSYRIDVSIKDNRANFELSNNSSFKSFSYGVGPAWERDSFSWMGNMSQTYSWSEELRGNGTALSFSKK